MFEREAAEPASRNSSVSLFWTVLALRLAGCCFAQQRLIPYHKAGGGAARRALRCWAVERNLRAHSCTHSAV